MTATTTLPAAFIPTAERTRHAGVVASRQTFPPEAECRTCGILPAAGLYDHAAEPRGRHHVQQTGHTVVVTCATSTVLRPEVPRG